MSYVPQPPDAFFPPHLPGGTPAFDVLWDNHNEVRDAYEQTLAVCGVAASTDNSVPLVWRFRQRGNLGLGRIQLEAHVEHTGGGTYEYYLANAAEMFPETVIVTGAGPHVVVFDMQCEVAEDEYFFRVTRTSGSGHSTVLGWSAWAEAPANASLVPGWRDAPSTNPWLVTDLAIAAEHMQRLVDGPSALAKDRPHCLLYHGFPVGSTLPKTDDPTWHIWGWTGSATRNNRWQQAGRGLFEVAGPSPRRVVVDVRVAAEGTAKCKISIGAVSQDVPTMNAWVRLFFDLQPGLHELIATPRAESTNDTVWVHALQVWRL